MAKISELSKFTPTNTEKNIFATSFFCNSERFLNLAFWQTTSETEMQE